MPSVKHEIMQVDLSMKTEEGISLQMTHFYRLGCHDIKLPSVLIRTPYDRRMVTWTAQRIADRGYHCITQDCRGRFDSGGDFFPIVHDARDGSSTLRWMEKQPFFDGTIGMYGPSYLGLTQYAVVDDAPESLKAITPIVAASHTYPIVFPHGALHLDLVLRWLYLVMRLRDPAMNLLQGIWRRMSMWWVLTKTFKHLPISKADSVIVDGGIGVYQELIQHVDPNDPYWKEKKARLCDLDRCPSVHVMAGWYDFFLRESLRDFEQLQKPKRRPETVNQLTVGPWYHWQMWKWFGPTLYESIEWFDIHLKGHKHKLRDKPVRLYVMGVEEYRDFDAWPPPCSTTAWNLHPAGRLSKALPPAGSSYSEFSYDPHEPTPSVGGPSFDWFNCGPSDQNDFERRSDVLVFTSQVLREDLLVIGYVSARLYLRSSVQHTDFVARLCDVYPSGRSVNLCDGLCRITPAHPRSGSADELDENCAYSREAGDLVTVESAQVGSDITPSGTGLLCIEVDMWATANQFKRGHRIRLQVASGGHPRWSRNLNTGDEYHGDSAVIANQTVFHDRSRPSALLLPTIFSL
eukprot:GILJ01012198.1.p1 GENE.GILJ01012198.1~~GILJ01012198.1.p1  ORF type:complete len:624 (+),score=72.41 GILJ01012198.1:153-1874(+)